MDTEQRMAGDYKIIHTLYVGDKALPDWAKQGLERIRQEEKQKRPKAREDR